MSRTFKVTALAALAVSGLALASCAAPAGDSEPAAPVDVDPHSPEESSATAAIFRQTAGVPFLLAAESSEEDYGLALEPSYIESSAASVSQLVAGDVQFAYSAYFGVVDAVQSGVELRIIGEQLVSTPGVQTLETMPDSGIEDLADLEGKKVAIPALNTTTDGKLKFDLDAEGLDPDAVEFVELPFGEVGAALQNGTVDAGVLLGVPLEQAKSTLNTRTVFDFGGEDWQGFPEAGWIVTADFAESNPNTVAAFQCAIADGTEIAINDEEQYTAQLRALGFDDAAIASTVKPDFASGFRDEGLGRIIDVKKVVGGSDFDIESLVIPTPDDC